MFASMSACNLANFSLVALTSSSAAYIPGSDDGFGAAGGSYEITWSAAWASETYASDGALSGSGYLVSSADDSFEEESEELDYSASWFSGEAAGVSEGYSEVVSAAAACFGGSGSDEAVLSVLSGSILTFSVEVSSLSTIMELSSSALASLFSESLSGIAPPSSLSSFKTTFDTSTGGFSVSEDSRPIMLATELSKADVSGYGAGAATGAFGLSSLPSSISTDDISSSSAISNKSESRPPFSTCKSYVSSGLF